jgi:hypothetical protein
MLWLDSVHGHVSSVQCQTNGSGCTHEPELQSLLHARSWSANRQPTPSWWPSKGDFRPPVPPETDGIGATCFNQQHAVANDTCECWSPPATTLAESIDWSACWSAVPPVNQIFYGVNATGSCWAIGSAEAVDGARCLKHGPLTKDNISSVAEACLLLLRDIYLLEDPLLIRIPFLGNAFLLFGKPLSKSRYVSVLYNSPTVIIPAMVGVKSVQRQALPRT